MVDPIERAPEVVDVIECRWGIADDCQERGWDDDEESTAGWHVVSGKLGCENCVRELIMQDEVYEENARRRANDL